MWESMKSGVHHQINLQYFSVMKWKIATKCISRLVIPCKYKGRRLDNGFEHLYWQCNRIIPSGWIHSVFTPEDSIVIGGNFLQGYAIEQQLNIYELEDRTSVPQKFRFPYFLRMNWYAAEKYGKLLEGKEKEVTYMRRIDILFVTLLFMYCPRSPWTS